MYATLRRASVPERAGARSNGISVTGSAERVGWWIRLLIHHCVTSGDESDAQRHVRRLYTGRTVTIFFAAKKASSSVGGMRQT